MAKPWQGALNPYDFRQIEVRLGSNHPVFRQNRTKSEPKHPDFSRTEIRSEAKHPDFLQDRKEVGAEVGHIELT